MSKKLNIFSFVAWQNGVGWYRMDEPFRVLQEQELVDLHSNPHNCIRPVKDNWMSAKETDTAETFIQRLGNNVEKAAAGADAAVMQRYDSHAFFSLMMGMKQVFKFPIIAEVDDYPHDIPSFNPGKQSYMEKPMDAPDAINDASMWARKSNGWYDAYIVSTPFLKKYYENYSPTYICPNSIDLRKRKFGEHEKHKEIRIGFPGSGGHQENLMMIEPVVEEILSKYPETVFYYYDGTRTRLAEKFGKRIRKMHWVNIDKYPEYLWSQHLDIVIAPLVDRMFNRAKSNLRLLESWSSGKYPIVASRVGEYAATIKDGVNGFLASSKEEWVDKISRLIESAKLRKTLGLAGYDTVKKDFNLEKNARIWYNAISDIKRNYRPGKQPPRQYIDPYAAAASEGGGSAYDKAF